jgi:hypothetical protein
MLASVLMVLGTLTVQSRFDDPDLWWNLKTGEVIWTTHSIPSTDLFSYTTNHHAWIAHEWLAQVLIYAAYRLDGYTGLMLLLCLLTATLLIAGYALCSLYSGNAKVAFVGALVIWLFATIGLAIRAQMLGYIFLIAELIFIQLGRTRNPRWFFWLPVLFAVWVNCHASFILGLIVGVVFWCGSFVSLRAGSIGPSTWNERERNKLAIALALSAAALFLNPVGIKLILYPLDTMFNMPVLLSSVAEYAPLQLTSGRGIGLMAVLVLCFLLVMMRKSEIFWDEVVLLALGTWMAVGHVRMLFVFGILAAPILSRELATLWDGYDAAKDRWDLNAGFAALAMVAAYFAFPSSADLRRQVAEKSPVNAVEYIQANHLSGPMLNDHIFGGYLMWAAPEHPVFLDGRTDVFEWTGVLKEFGNWATLQTDPHVLLDKYDVGFCLLSRDSPMARVLPLLPDWKTVYSDNNAVVIQRVPSLAEQANTGAPTVNTLD